MTLNQLLLVAQREQLQCHGEFPVRVIIDGVWHTVTAAQPGTDNFILIAKKD